MVFGLGEFPNFQSRLGCAWEVGSVVAQTSPIRRVGIVLLSLVNVCIMVGGTLSLAGFVPLIKRFVVR
jgi:hypothetical protein